jgi:hypothetical protein
LRSALDRIAHFARITHVDRESLQAFDRFADIVAADGTETMLCTSAIFSPYRAAASRSISTSI